MMVYGYMYVSGMAITSTPSSSVEVSKNFKFYGYVEELGDGA